VAAAWEQIPPERRGRAELIFTAHSLPAGMAAGCDYVRQLQESCRLVVEQLGPDVRPARWQLCYQSRSGPPSQPWLEPDICDVLAQLADQGQVRDVVVCPIGFISDHMEVLFDLDTEAQQLCQQRGLQMVRAETVGTHPRFVHMIGELIRERTEGSPRQALGTLGPSHDVCPEDCCLSGRPAAAS
jgi:ferrochelatase